MRVGSWNVNGLRGILRSRALPGWLERRRPDIVCLQETRTREADLAGFRHALRGWHVVLASGTRERGRDGVGIMARTRPDNVEDALGDLRDGRYLLARFGQLHVASVYVPPGLPYTTGGVEVKFDFLDRLYDRLTPRAQAGDAILLCGDFNTSLAPIDLFGPEENATIRVVMQRSTEAVLRWIDAGWIDTFRRFDPSPGKYSWWSPQGTRRQENIGRRIDFVFASPAAAHLLQGAFLDMDTMGSDHCPHGVDLTEAP